MNIVYWIILTVLGSAMALALLSVWSISFVYNFWWVIVLFCGWFTWQEFFKDKS